MAVRWVTGRMCPQGHGDHGCPCCHHTPHSCGAAPRMCCGWPAGDSTTGEVTVSQGWWLCTVRFLQQRVVLPVSAPLETEVESKRWAYLVCLFQAGAELLNIYRCICASLLLHWKYFFCQANIQPISSLNLPQCCYLAWKAYQAADFLRGFLCRL